MKMLARLYSGWVGFWSGALSWAAIKATQGDTVRNVGLFLFIAFVCPAFLVILFDAGLLFAETTARCSHVETISQYVRAHPAWAWAILGALQIGVIGLGLHFFYPVKS